MSDNIKYKKFTKDGYNELIDDPRLSDSEMFEFFNNAIGGFDLYLNEINNLNIHGNCFNWDEPELQAASLPNMTKRLVKWNTEILHGRMVVDRTDGTNTWTVFKCSQKGEYKFSARLKLFFTVFTGTAIYINMGIMLNGAHWHEWDTVPVASPYMFSLQGSEDLKLNCGDEVAIYLEAIGDDIQNWDYIKGYFSGCFTGNHSKLIGYPLP